MKKLVSNPEVGKLVTRWLAGTIPMDLPITKVTDDRIICGSWTFDRTTGAEIDEDLNWGAPPLATGSFISEKEDAHER